jgi:hypothetical protein
MVKIKTKDVFCPARRTTRAVPIKEENEAGRKTDRFLSSGLSDVSIKNADLFQHPLLNTAQERRG